VAFAALTLVVAIAIWAVLSFFRKEGASPSFRSALLVTELVLLLQGGVGAFLVLTGRQPRQGLHFVYGILAAVVIPVAYGYTASAARRREPLIWMLALLALAGLVIRALTTGRA
jgi:heme A synthase